MRRLASNQWMESKPKNVDEYIEAAPKGVQVKLREVRAAIREAAPLARESISYGMAYYDFEGRLAWFGYHSGHVGLYLRPPVVEEHREDLKSYVTTKSAVHLSLAEKTPVRLIKKLVRARMRINESEKRK